MFPSEKDRLLPLVDSGGYPEFFADNVAEVHPVGTTADIVFFRWRKIEGVWRKCVCGIVTRPRASLMTPVALFREAMEIPDAMPAIQALLLQ